MAKVTLHNVWKIYDNGVEAVKELNLECPDKAFLCLLGPSGCGKSSTMRMIAGLEKISSGEIFIGDRLVNYIPPRDRDIAMVFENYALYPHLTVYENIAMPLRVRKFEKEEINRRVVEAAKILDIEDLLPRRIRRLSGGQKQRVGIGRAIVRSPAVFIMDEPISHLEAKLRAQMRAELKRLHNQLEATTIYVTHDQLEAIALADYIAVMNFGELQQFGAPEDLYENPANHFVAGFLGTPPMNFIEGHFERSDGDLWFRNEHFNLCLDKFTRAKLDAVKSVENITLGVRPQDIHISKTRDENHDIKSRTFIWELQGEKNQAVLEIGRHHFIAEAEADFVSQTGEDVWIQVNLDHIHFFDSSTGKNILI